MAFVKCRYTEIECGNNFCWRNEDEKFQCEYWDDDGVALCRSGEPTEKYIEGTYKKVTYDGSTLKIGSKTIACYPIGPFQYQYAEGIDFLEIDGHVYIGENNAEEQT